MNHFQTGCGPLAVALFLVLGGAPLTSARAEGLSLTVGLTTTCPYGAASG
jgi:hypothetical protein